MSFCLILESFLQRVLDEARLLQSLAYLIMLCHSNILPHLFLLKLPCPTCNCAYINTFISIHCLNIAMNVDGRKFFLSQELNNVTLFEPHLLTPFHFDWH